MRLFWHLLMPILTLAESTSISADNSYWYDWGIYGAYPRQYYESFPGGSPWTNVRKWSSRCDDRYVFVEPRGLSVPTPGPVILDNKGNLVWMETEYGQAMDLKVQNYRGNNYITIWTGTDSGTFGTGRYLMLDSSYELFKTVGPAGNLTGDLHDFRITDQGTALMTIYELRPADLSAFGISSGWIYDSLFQEVDIETGDLIFEWRASDHYAINETRAPIRSYGKSSESAFDFFHINSVDKDASGNYLISSRYMCAVSCISPKGEVTWQLGGNRNHFTDLSHGAATNFSWQHHASWHENNTITVFDNGAYEKLVTAEHSRGLYISLDVQNMTASLIQDFVSPDHIRAPSQGSVQILPETGNVLVGWGHTPAYTEFSSTGEVLCDVHLGAIAISFLGWCKNYRTFKYDWVGRPKTLPDVVMKPSEDSLYVSWNGATEVNRWVVQSSSTKGGDKGWAEVDSVLKETFETRIEIPDDTANFLRVAALDKAGNVLSYSDVLSAQTGQYLSGRPSPIPDTGISVLQLLLGASGFVGILIILWVFIVPVRNAFDKVSQHIFSYKYSKLPQN